MGRGPAESGRTHNLPVSPRTINGALTAVVIFCFLSHVATEVADYLSGPRPGRLPVFLWLAFLPFALVSMGLGPFEICHALFAGFWSEILFRHINETETDALLLRVYLLFTPSTKILSISLLCNVFALSGDVVLRTLGAVFLEQVFDLVGPPTT